MRLFFGGDRSKAVFLSGVGSWARTFRALLICCAEPRPRFFCVVTTVVRVLRVCAPASVTEPKLTLRAMTEGRKSRLAKLFSAGTLLSSDQW